MTMRLAAAPVLLLTIALAGCATTVRAPFQVLDPIPVFIVDHAYHSSLIIPAPEGGGLTEFAYGEWRWFGLEEQVWWRAFGVMLLPNQAAFGRRELNGPVTWESVFAQTPHEHLFEVRVERRRAYALHRRLSQEWEAGKQHVYYNPVQRLHFVRHPEPYHILHHCNGMTADWLVELGCRVEGVSLVANFIVTDAW